MISKPKAAAGLKIWSLWREAEAEEGSSQSQERESDGLLKYLGSMLVFEEKIRNDSYDLNFIILY